MDETTHERLPLELVTGFLGSGKTTLIGQLLRDPAFAGAMVIVNEFGDVGLDHLLISSAQDQVLLLDSGCLCCAVSDSLRDTLIDLFSRRASGAVPTFDRIIVETSGLANPAPLVATLIGDSAITPRCMLSQVLTLVDGINGVETLQRYHESRRQVAMADRLVITKTDAATPAQIEQVRQALVALNPQARIEHRGAGDPPAAHFLAAGAQPPGGSAARATGVPAWLRGPLRPQYGGGETATHGEAFGQLVTHVVHVPGAVTWDAYAAWTDAMRRRFGKRLLRCKGLLAIEPAAAAQWVVQGVQGYFARPVPLAGAPEATCGWLVCIGEALDRAELDETVAVLHPVASMERKS